MCRHLKLLGTVLTLLALFAPASGFAEETTPEDLAADCTLDPTEIYLGTDKSVWNVWTIYIDPMRLAGRITASSGSAIALGGGGFITNYHVVGKSEEVLLIAGEETLTAYVVGRDPALDIAVLYAPFDQFSGISEALPFSTGEATVPGQPAFVIGYPLDGVRSISGGMISAVQRFLPLNTSSWTTRYIQTDAAISPGHSGGALVDQCGRLIGMVTIKSIGTGVDGIGYALPAESLEPLIPELIETGRIARPWHGLYGQMVSPNALALMGADPAANITGFLIETIEPGSGADRAGLRGGDVPVLWGLGEFILGGDIITEVNGRAIRQMDDAISIVEGLAVGDEVSIAYLRDGETKTTSVTLEERPFFESDALIPHPQ